MCAARVLPEFYDHVTVYERDDLPDRPANRAAVPQGRHVHLLMPRGAQEFERLYPGRLDGMVAEGCRSWRTAPTASTSARRDTCWAPGTPLREEFTAYVPSRPQLEWQIRRRTIRLPSRSPVCSSTPRVTTRRWRPTSPSTPPVAARGYRHGWRNGRCSAHPRTPSTWADLLRHPAVTLRPRR